MPKIAVIPCLRGKLPEDVRAYWAAAKVAWRIGIRGLSGLEEAAGLTISLRRALQLPRANSEVRSSLMEAEVYVVLRADVGCDKRSALHRTC